MTMTPTRRVRLAAVWLISVYLGLMYVRMGLIKFDADGFWTGAFERWGYPSWLRWAVGAGETAGGVLVMVPWVASYAAVALIAIMVGAWVTRFNDARFVDVAWISLYIAGLAWIGFEWWFKRLGAGRSTAGA